MKRYIIFDAHCSICTELARAIRESSDGKLAALSIHDNEAKTLLDRAYPEGWEHTPYFVAVEQDEVYAWTGFGAAFQLMRLIGIRNTWRVWRLAYRNSIVLPQGSKVPFIFNARRQFLKKGLAAIMAAMVNGVSVAYACIPCEDCGMTCYGSPCRCAVPCPGDYQPCIRWDCYDDRTGEYCFTFCSDCSCCGCICV